MPGFFVSNKKVTCSLKDAFPERCVQENLKGLSDVTAIRQTLNKFLYDKCFEDTTDYIVILEGYLLNKRELFSKYNATTICGLMINLILEYGDEPFFKEFRGCFSGAYYVKSEKKWIVFTNQIGDNPIFYVYSNGIFAAGSQVNYLVDFCRRQYITLSFNEECAYQMLTFGYVAGNDTYANQIRRLHGGDYIVVTDHDIEVKTYHRFEAHPERMSDKTEEGIIDMIDVSFRHAVQLEWDKDDEYGYKHLGDLSGGLDSRMNIWVAHELKNRQVSLLTYSKAGEADEVISKQIAAYWNDELLFKPLDDINFMKDIDENTGLLNGLSLYSGITGGKRMLQSLDLSSFGIEHTGMVGDIALGSFYHKKSDFNNRPTGRYSEKLVNKLPNRIRQLHEKYNDYEVYLMYVRGFHGACNSHLIRRNYTEVGSPFLNVEFMQLCYDIPVELRMNHYIYKKWIITKHPSAAEFKWEKLGGKITENKVRTQVRVILKRGPRKLLKILGYKPNNNRGMNPIDYWLTQNDSVKSYLDKYENEAVSNCKRMSSGLLHDIDWLYKNGNAWEKSMALTVLAAEKLYFGETTDEKSIE